MRNHVTMFAHKEGHSLFEAREIFKEILSMCPHHGFEKWLIVNKHYNGLTCTTRVTMNIFIRGGINV